MGARICCPQGSKPFFSNKLRYGDGPYSLAYCHCRSGGKTRITTQFRGRLRTAPLGSLGLEVLTNGEYKANMRTSRLTPMDGADAQKARLPIRGHAQRRTASQPAEIHGCLPFRLQQSVGAQQRTIPEER